MGTRTKKDPGFPLSYHPQGYYCKRIGGKLHYFGKRYGDRYAALEQYLLEKPYLEAGLKPPAQGSVTLEVALDRFLVFKRERMRQGDLGRRSYDEYHRQCARILQVISRARVITSIMPNDFTRLRRKFTGTPKTIEGYVTRSMVAFRWIEKQFDVKFNFGDDFKKPSARKLRLHRNQQPKRLFTADEIHELVAKARPRIKAMILLGINCGFGNEDCATFMIESLELGWHNHGRPKTGVMRRAALWPETESALRVVIDGRSKGFVFLTKYGNPWSNGTSSSPIGKEFKKLGSKLTFYDLRRTFQTIADNSKDPVAVKAIMGHIDGTMSGFYRQAIPDERLQAVSEVVHEWYLEKAHRDMADHPELRR